jgi:hypothetical protein
LDDSIASLRWEVCAHKYSLTLPLMIEEYVPSREIARSCIYVRCTDFDIAFWNCSDSVVFWNCSDSVVFWICSEHWHITERTATLFTSK